jgi:ABC-type polysaccharide/polyol phosphate transport system ATPase subunit
MIKNKTVSTFSQEFRISCINTYINKKLANYSGMCLCLVLCFALNSKFSYLLVQ